MYVLKCPHCDLRLTFHKKEDQLRCHLCDFTRELGQQCPHCHQSGTLEFKGFGTEHVERSLHAVFPEVRTLRMDKDTTRTKNSHEELFKQFRAHKADVLIGTQMIAKGFHFASVTLVGVLNTDAALSIPDFRAPEHLFQLITQVAGRAGRAELPGEVILQTFLPDHPALNLAASQDYEAFFQREIEERKTFGYPPFCHLIKIVCSSLDPLLAEKAAQTLYRQILEHLPSIAQLLPVIPSGHAKVQDKYRFQFIIKCLKISDITNTLEELQPPKEVDLKIDVDPTSIFI
jgi:primosomal protein N' (replication factor Y) (superfamily II helicase)